MHISWAVNQEITYIFNSHRSPKGIQELGHGSKGKKDEQQLLFCNFIWLGQTKVEHENWPLNFKEWTQFGTSEGKKWAVKA